MTTSADGGPADNQSANDTRTVIVTGAGRRLGRKLALDFAQRGWQVAVHYHTSVEAAAEVVAEIERSGGRALAIRADLADPAALAPLVETCWTQLGPACCLINNASRFVHDDIDSLTAAGWDDHIDTNLRAPILLAQAFARQLPEGQSGNIINIVDQRVWKPTPEFLSYSVSKAGLWAATRILAQALAPHIRVNAIGPGPMLESVHQTRDQFERQSAATLLKRGTSPEEIAAGIRFILDAPAMTGQMIVLDGGQHLAWETADVIGVDR